MRGSVLPVMTLLLNTEAVWLSGYLQGAAGKRHQRQYDANDGEKRHGVDQRIGPCLFYS